MMKVEMLSSYQLEDKLLKRHQVYKLDAALADFLIKNSLAIIKNDKNKSFFNKMLKIKYK